MIINNVVDGGPALCVPGHLNFGQYIIETYREIARENDRVALINGETGSIITFRQIIQDIVNIATGLKKMGVKRGSVVAMCSENRDEFIPAALGAVCCGATITTVNMLYSKDEMLHVLNISKPSLILCSENALKANLKTLRSVSSIKKIVQINGAPLDKKVIPLSSVVVQTNVDDYEAEEVHGWTDVIFILYSSGTTGLPKGVMLTHLNALYAAANFHENKSDNEEKFSTISTLVPWYHAYGLISTINYLAVKKKLVYFSGFNPVKYLEAIQKYKVNVLTVVPPIVVFLAKHPMVATYDLSSVKIVWCGAAPLSADTINAAMARMPNCEAILQAYGMTETSLAATKDEYDEESMNIKIGSGGIPLKGVKAKVVDIETRQKLGPNKKGEICLKGPIIMKGYMGDQASTRNIMDEEGYLKTGDIGYYDQDGHFFIVDRLKELIKYKGSQVPPALVESVLLQHPGVAECGVVGRPDEKVGELPTAFVVLKPEVQVTEKEILEFTDERLSPEKRLYGGVLFVSEIPKNPSGKILRRILKQQLLNKKRSKL